MWKDVLAQIFPFIFSFSSSIVQYESTIRFRIIHLVMFSNYHFPKEQNETVNVYDQKGERDRMCEFDDWGNKA